MALAGLYRVTQDLEGNVVTGVLGTVTLSGTSTLATMFADAAGTLPLPNPTTNNAQYGSFDLFLDAGTYDMQFVKSGYVFETQRSITLRDPAAGVNTITGTANQVLVSPPGGVGAVTLSLPQGHAPDSDVQFNHMGLGTPAPTDPTRLRVAGDVRLDNRLGIGEAAAAPYFFIVAAGLPSLFRDKVGIGGGAPTDTLTVTGTATCNGPVGLGEVSDFQYRLLVAGSLPSLFRGSLGVGGGPPLEALTVTGNARVTGAVGIGTTPGLSGTALAVSGNASFTGGTLTASSVAITGGNANGLTTVDATLLTAGAGLGVGEVAQNARFISAVRGLFRAELGVGNVDPSYTLDVNGTAHITGAVGIGTTPGLLGTNLAVAPGKTLWQSGSQVGININPAYSFQVQGNVGIQVYSRSVGMNALTIVPDADSGGGGSAVAFLNAALAVVGGISTSSTTTVYATTSDARLKHAITPLTGELALVGLLRPVSFLWNADDSPGVGFLAHEVAAQVAGVITGEPDAVDEEGRILPQLIDYSKLVPWLVGAIQTLVQRLEVVEDAAGV